MGLLEDGRNLSRKPHEIRGITPRPTLSEVLDKLNPLPREAMFLGIASDDELPILLDMEDANVGPLAVIGDRLDNLVLVQRIAAAAITSMHSREHVQYVTITPDVQGWKDLGNSPNSAILADVDEKDSVSQALLGLTAWASNNRGSHQKLVLFIDNLSAFTDNHGDDCDIMGNLFYLLKKGAQRHVWPIVTMDTTTASSSQLTQFFRTRFFGYTQDDLRAWQIGAPTQSNPSQLIPGLEYVIKEGNHSLPFWLPALD